jgi:hypothetical protein
MRSFAPTRQITAAVWVCLRPRLTTRATRTAYLVLTIRQNGEYFTCTDARYQSLVARREMSSALVPNCGSC